MGFRVPFCSFGKHQEFLPYREEVLKILLDHAFGARGNPVSYFAVRRRDACAEKHALVRGACGKFDQAHSVVKKGAIFELWDDQSPSGSEYRSVLM